MRSTMNSLRFALSAFLCVVAFAAVAQPTDVKPVWNGYLVADGRLSGDGHVLVCPGLDDKMRNGGDCQRGMYPKYTVEPSLKLTLQEVLDRQPSRAPVPARRVAVGIG